MPIISRSQLASRNGVDRDMIWIAYKGIVYEVTESRHWRNGIHYGHWSGQELDDELAEAPHAEEVFKRFKAVGRLPEN
ncbi:MAG: cytochrome b5 [Bacteroidia bacterium]